MVQFFLGAVGKLPVLLKDGANLNEFGRKYWNSVECFSNLNRIEFAKRNFLRHSVLLVLESKCRDFCPD